MEAIGYMRTSSATNVGEDKDSELRQRAAIEAYAARAGFEIEAWYYDAAVKGADHITDRPGFAAMLARIVGNGVRTIIVESPDRFARDLMVQLVGHDHLKSLGVTLIPASAPTFFVEETPTAVMIRQILGAVAQFEKANTVAKLAAARARKKAKTGKCGGRKSYDEIVPEAVSAALELRQLKPKLPLRTISACLFHAGHATKSGKAYSTSAIKSMLETPTRANGAGHG